MRALQQRQHAIPVAGSILSTLRHHGIRHATRKRYAGTAIFFFPLIPFVVLALLSPSLPAVTQIRGHIVGPSLPAPRSPLRYVFFFIPFIILALLSPSLPAQYVSGDNEKGGGGWKRGAKEHERRGLNGIGV